MPRGGAAVAQQAAPPPGSLFGLPGFTQRMEEWEPWFDVSTTLNQASQKQITEGADFQRTDVILWWELFADWTNTLTLGGGSASTSPWFPYNILGPLSLPMQGKYKPVDVESGIDLAIFQSYRPMRKTGRRTNLGANPASAWPNSAFPQANLNTGASLTSASSPIHLELDIPGSMYFDRYYDLALDGTLLSPLPVAGHISPQYMGGSERVVRPKVTTNPGIVSNLDEGPFAVTGGTPSYAGSLVTSFRRVGVRGSNNPAEMPMVRNWQYVRKSDSVGIGAMSKKTIPLAGEEFGQILSLFVRLWDPSANGGLGAPIGIDQVKTCRLLYGSGLARFDDTPQTMQRRFLEQHGFLPPVGTLVWDLAVDNVGNVSNAGALNTITTSNVGVEIEFTGAQAAEATCIVGVEALNFVSAA